MGNSAKTVAISEFKAKCLRLVEDVAKGDELIISKRGKPIARVVRFVPEERRTSRGALKGSIEFVGDIVHPGWDQIFDLE